MSRRYSDEPFVYAKLLAADPRHLGLHRDSLVVRRSTSRVDHMNDERPIRQELGARPVGLDVGLLGPAEPIGYARRGVRVRARDPDVNFVLLDVHSRGDERRIDRLNHRSSPWTPRAIAWSSFQVHRAATTVHAPSGPATAVSANRCSSSASVNSATTSPPRWWSTHIPAYSGCCWAYLPTRSASPSAAVTCRSTRACSSGVSATPYVQTAAGSAAVA